MLGNQVSRLQGQRTVCLRSRRIGHPQPFVAPPDLRSSISSSSRLRVNSADLSRFYPTDSNCISCAANISNCSACNLANGVPLKLLRQRACCIAPGAVPSATASTRLTQPESYPADAHCTTCAANASNCSARKLADGYLLDPYTAIPSRSQPESQQATEPTRATTPECTHAQKPTALHAAPTPRTVLLATRNSMATSEPIT